MIATSPNRTPSCVWYAKRWLRTSGLRGIRGSSMGMTHLSSISDLAFYVLAEKSRVAQKNQYGVNMYRDDILVVVNSSKASRRFLEELKRRATPCSMLEN